MARKPRRAALRPEAAPPAPAPPAPDNAVAPASEMKKLLDDITASPLSPRQFAAQVDETPELPQPPGEEYGRRPNTKYGGEPVQCPQCERLNFAPEGKPSPQKCWHCGNLLKR